MNTFVCFSVDLVIFRVDFRRWNYGRMSGCQMDDVCLADVYCCKMFLDI